MARSDAVYWLGFFYAALALIGFVIVDRGLSEGEPTPPEVVNIRSDFVFSKDFATPGVLASGWKRPEAWGTRANAARGVLELPLDGNARGDVALLAQAETKLLRG